METLRLLVLLQFAATLYLVYRVHRLEQSLGVRGRAPRQSQQGRGAGSGKVVPLLKEEIPPGPFRPQPGSSDTNGER